MKGNVEKEDPLWTLYLDKAAVFDTRTVDEWNKIVDVLLVYVGDFLLFSSSRISCLALNHIGCPFHLRPNRFYHSNLCPIPTQSG